MKVLVINGHPDPSPERLACALATAYANGARSGGHEVRELRIGELDFQLVRARRDWENDPPPPAIRDAQDALWWADHVVFIYPLWLGAMPALLKGFLEQVLRPGFAIEPGKDGGMWKKKLTGRSARVIVTMGMPGFVYRIFFRAHSLKSFERNILKFCGIKPVRETLIGMVEGLDPKRRDRWLDRLRTLGRQAR